MRRVGFLVGLVVLVAGCGGGSNTGGGGTTVSAGGKTITIDEKEFSLAPSSVSISEPGTYMIKGVNKGTVSHAIAIEGEGIDQDGAIVGPGGTSEITVSITKPGKYEFYCPVDSHKDMGMEGTLTLGSAAGGGGTSTGTSTEDNGGGYKY